MPRRYEINPSANEPLLRHAMLKREDITGVILAGGQGLRMGGLDKGLVPYPPGDHGEPLVAHALKRLAPQVGPVIINANRNLDRYAAYGHPIVSDKLSGFQGPLAGIAAALQVCSTPWLVTVPCDSPAFPIDLVNTLAQALEKHSAPACAAYAITPADPHHPQHPVFCMLHRTVVPTLEADLAQGERRLHRWLCKVNALAVAFENTSAFNNMNSAKEMMPARAESSSI